MVRLGLVISEFDKTSAVIPAMESAAERAVTEADAEIVERIRVPGSYDTPLAADRLARREDIDAVVVLGAIITGDTDHDQVIAQAAATGLTSVSIDRDTPVALGIIGPGMTEAEARDRSEYGATAVTSAIQLANDST